MPDPIGNKATSAWARLVELAYAGDWDAVERSIAPAATREDRRRLVGLTAENRDELLASARALVESVGMTEATSTPRQTRGDRLALSHTQQFSPSGFVLEYLQVTELDDQGRIAALVYYDLEDEDAAEADLARRWGGQP